MWVHLGLLAYVASSQALPALKVAIDDECSGKGLVFTKNNQPDFGLLFLAQFARFLIRTETEATVHTHSQTNRHLRLCPAASFGFSVGNRKLDASKEPGLDLCLSDDQSVLHASSVLTFAKSSSVSVTRFGSVSAVCVSQISSNGSQFDHHAVFKKSYTWAQRIWRGKLKQLGTLAHSVPLKTDRNVSCTVLRVWSLKSMFVFHTPHFGDRRWHGRHASSNHSNFESEKASAFCTQNFYDGQCTPGKLR